MKTHILSIMSVSFGILVLTRAAQVSSEVRPEQAVEPAHDTSQTLLSATPINAGGKCLTGETYEALSADLEHLEEREKEISIREKSLLAIETRLSGQLATVEDANSKLQGKIDSLKTVANDDLKHLVGMYQTMKPKQAATIFDSMDPNFAAGFLREMSSDKAGLIMANMDARKSYAISVIIAGRNAQYR
ncbi:MAG: MotE family protein [Alphaproteobacteria bacterium]